MIQGYMYSLDSVAAYLKKYGYSILSSDGKTENTNKIYLKKNILVEIHFDSTYLGTRINELCLVDNNYGFDNLSQRFVMTTSIVESSIYSCTGIPLEKFMEIATGPMEHIHMRVENYMNEKALEVL